MFRAAVSVHRAVVLAVAASVLVAWGCRRARDDRRDDVPGTTETRSGEVQVAPIPAPGTVRLDPEGPRREPMDPRGAPAEPESEAPAIAIEPREREATTDAGTTATRRPLPGADDSERPSWLPDTDRLSVIPTGDRDRNMGLTDAGASAEAPAAGADR